MPLMTFHLPTNSPLRDLCTVERSHVGIQYTVGLQLFAQLRQATTPVFAQLGTATNFLGAEMIRLNYNSIDRTMLPLNHINRVATLWKISLSSANQSS